MQEAVGVGAFEMGMAERQFQQRREMSTLYEQDFYAWTRVTADQIRQGDFDGIDRQALAEEVEDLGKRDRRAVENRAAVLVAHLLKWKHQPARRSR